MTEPIHDREQARLPIEIDGKGISFDREYNGDGVEICVEYDDGSWADRTRTAERYVTIGRQDWERVVAVLSVGQEQDKP